MDTNTSNELSDADVDTLLGDSQEGSPSKALEELSQEQEAVSEGLGEFSDAEEAEDDFLDILSDMADFDEVVKADPVSEEGIEKRKKLEKEEPKEEEVEEAEEEKSEEAEEEAEEEKEEEVKPAFEVPEWAKDYAEFGDEFAEVDSPEKFLEATQKLKDAYKEELQANDKLVELFEKNETLSQLVRDMSKGEVFEAALIKALDFDSLKALVDENNPELDGATRTQLIRARLEREQQVEKSKAEQERLMKEFNGNVEKSNEIIAKFAKDNKVEEGEYKKFLQSVESHISNVARGVVSPELLELLYKGSTIETRLEEIRETARKEGRNTAITEAKKKKTGSGIPALNGSPSNLQSGEIDPFDAMLFEVAEDSSRSF